MHEIIRKLIVLIETNPDWYHTFNRVINKIKSLDEFKDINDLQSWLEWCNSLLYWIPVETPDGNNVDHKLTKFYFVFNQTGLQKTPLLSQWMIDYAKEIGKFLDTTESINEESLKTFTSYDLSQYQKEPSGWKTFNQFFARRVKPGFRPIDNIHNKNVIVSVADSVFKGQWDINDQSQITVKGINWSIKELLHNIPYSNYFNNGLFIHCYLSPSDYHRFHTPLEGKVLHTEIVQGNVYLETYIKDNKLKTWRPKYIIGYEDGVGYQFTQTRGILILETRIGLVAIIPVGMSLVSSVTITAEKNTTLYKGEEFGYFQFGGSDYIMLFENKPIITAKVNTHYKQGKRIGH